MGGEAVLSAATMREQQWKLKDWVPRERTQPSAQARTMGSTAATGVRGQEDDLAAGTQAERESEARSGVER